MNELHESDKRLISMIRESEGLSAGDPAPQLSTLNFLVFSDQAMATLAADEAIALGWIIDEGPTQSPDTGHWHLNLKGTDKTISEEAVLRFRTELENLAARYGGTFEFWGAAQSAAARANKPSQFFKPLNEAAMRFLDELRVVAQQAEVENDPTAMTELFNSVFVDWINLPEQQRDRRPSVISLIAVALGDWISLHTDLEWKLLHEGPTKKVALSSPPSIVLRSASTGAVMFIFDSIAKRWGSRERLDDFAFGSVRQMRNHAPKACADIPAPPKIIRISPFDSIDEDFRQQALARYKTWANDFTPRSIELAFAKAFPPFEENRSNNHILREQNEALEALGFAFGEYLREQLIPEECAWVIIHQADGTKIDAIATPTNVITEIHSAIAAFANKNGNGFAAYAEDSASSVIKGEPWPEP